MMSGLGQGLSGFPAGTPDVGQPVKKQPTFSKSDFVIRPKSADTFSQLDTFKITANKPKGM